MAVVTRFMREQAVRLETEIQNLKSLVKTKPDDVKLAFARCQAVAAELRRALVPNQMTDEEKLRAKQSFEKFWHRYPKKEKRIVAIDAWMNRPELHNMEGEPFKQAMYALDCWKETRQWEQEIIHLASTWLNQQLDKDFPKPRQRHAQ